MFSAEKKSSNSFRTHFDAIWSGSRCHHPVIAIENGRSGRVRSARGSSCIWRLLLRVEVKSYHPIWKSSRSLSAVSIYEHHRAPQKRCCAQSNTALDLKVRAAGRGAIVNVLRAHGHAAIASDIVEDGFPLHFVGDFLAQAKVRVNVECILMNPPFRSSANWLTHALALLCVVFTWFSCVLFRESPPT